MLPFQSLILKLAKTSGYTSKTARNFGKICFELLCLFRYAKRGRALYSQDIYEEQLWQLTSQVHLKPPVISVHGFFNLDYKLFFFIINFATSYTVVLLRYVDSTGFD